jgi:hypothetical protein
MNKKLIPLTKTELEEYINLGMSSYDIAKKIGRGQTTIRYWLKKYVLKTNCKLERKIAYTNKTSNCKFCNKPFDYRIKKIYCSNKCQGLMQSAICKESIRTGCYSTPPTRRLIYSMLCEDFGNACSLCGVSGDNWNQKPIRLWVDHIDGCAANNSYSNFRLICPNCDSQLDTCRAKNKGKGRKSIGLRW